MGRNEADVVRSARPKGKKCRLIYIVFSKEYLTGFQAISGLLPDIAVIAKVAAFFMNNSGKVMEG